MSHPAELEQRVRVVEASGGGGGGGGVTDHGALTGLGDDDHPQYLRQVEADALYDGNGAAASAVAAHAGAADPHPGYLTQAEGDARYAALLKGSAVLTVPANSWDHTETIAVTGAAAGMVGMVSLAQHLDTDENGEEFLSVVAQRATAQTNALNVLLVFAEPTGGPVRINYMVS